MPTEKYLSTEKVLGISEDSNFSPTLLALIEKVVGAQKLNSIMDDIGQPWPDAGPLIDILFERLNISWRCENPEILENLDDGPKVFVANHPYGLPDAFALFQLLTAHRPNIKIFANKLLAATQLEEERLLFVDPFAADASKGQNRRSIATAIKHLRQGGDLALFPGRICSHLKTSDWTISDSEWTDQVRRFVEVSGGEMVPLYISGRNSMLFNVSGLIHPRIRTYMLLREFLRGGHDFTFRVGDPVNAPMLSKVSESLSVGSFSRSLVYALKTGASKVPDIPSLISPDHRTEFETREVSRKPKAISGDAVKSVLDTQEHLIEQNGYTIYQMNGAASEEILDMICEVRFQAYASQTNVSDASELRDKYDDFYNHFILWDHADKKIIGVYRYTLPNPDKIAVTENNLVTSSIFDLASGFDKYLPNSMELGRAAILPEYQKSFSPLMLLWRAILEIPKRDKSIKYLFGPVTMGRNFNPVSRELLRRYIMNNLEEKSISQYFSPKKSLSFDIPREVDMKELETACSSFAKLGNIIDGIEGGKRQLPVLFRHYANVGCKYAGFGEWKALDQATAGITILDLADINKTLIRRYFGREGAQEFLLER